ncbi:MAG TPA: LEA type 2 family protein [Longimicrobiales bacterium]
MTSRHRKRVAIASAMFVLTSCMESPVVDLTRVRVGGIGFEGATLVAQLQVDNPNRFGIKTDSVTFELQARDAGSNGNWTRVAAGTYPRQFEVAGRSSSRVDIPIELAYSALSTPVRSIIQRGRFDYRLTGQVFVRRPFPKRVPFTQDGSLSIFESR